MTKGLENRCIFPLSATQQSTDNLKEVLDTQGWKWQVDCIITGDSNPRVIGEISAEGLLPNGLTVAATWLIFLFEEKEANMSL